MEAVIEVTTDTFESVVSQSELPVLVDFWAPWCGPCKALAPVLKTVAEDLKGKVTVVKINADEQQDLAVRFSVRGLPTLAILQKGEVLVQRVGFLNRDQLLQWVESNLGLEEG